MTARIPLPTDVTRLPKDIYNHLNRIEGKLDALAETVHNNNVDAHNARGNLAKQIQQMGSSLESKIDGLDLTMDDLDSRIDNLQDGINALLNGQQ